VHDGGDDAHPARVAEMGTFEDDPITDPCDHFGHLPLFESPPAAV
jgi:hypothetical protein